LIFYVMTLLLWEIV